MNTAYTQYLPAMQSAARAAGAVLRDHFSALASLEIEVKAPGDFVSDADRDAERVIRDALGAAHPGFSFLLEEEGAVAGVRDDFCWAVDPLDGTSNFVRGVPHFSVSIGLVHDGAPVAGVVFHPMMDELFDGASGAGARLNGAAVAVAPPRDPSAWLFATGFPFRDKTGHETSAREIVGPMKTGSGVRRFGSAAIDLAYVAAGRFDAFWERDLSVWDVAAGFALVRAAGGRVTTIENDAAPLPTHSILATNGHCHAAASSLILTGRRESE